MILMSYGIQKALKDILGAIVSLGNYDSAVLASYASADNESAAHHGAHQGGLVLHSTIMVAGY